MKLLIAFSDPEVFNIKVLKKFISSNEKILMICPYDFIYSIFSLRNKLFNKPFDFFSKKTSEYLKKNILDLEIKVEKPNLFHIIYFLPISLIKSLINTTKLTKILRGNRSLLYFKGIDMTEYCLESLQRYFGRKFLIANENNFQNIFLSFVYLVCLEIYLNWFFSNFKKKKIKEVIINHEVYAECALLAECSQKLNGSEIFFSQITYRKLLKFSNIRKSVYNYIPHVEKNKDFENVINWYGNNSIKLNKNLKNKKIDPSKVLIVMHAFSDAGVIHSETSPLFQSFYHWIKKTLEIAKSHKNQQFIFRIHPDTFEFFHNDRIIISKLFKNLSKNIHVEDPRLVNPDHHFVEKLPLIVTFKGSIILEMGCSGVNVVSLSSIFPGQCSIVPSTLEEYENILSGKLNLSKMYLNEKQIENYEIQRNNIIDALNSEFIRKNK